MLFIMLYKVEPLFVSVNSSHVITQVVEVTEQHFNGALVLLVKQTKRQTDPYSRKTETKKIK